DPELAEVIDGFGGRITTRWSLGHMPRPRGEEKEGAPAEAVPGEETPAETGRDVPLETHVFDGSASGHRYLARRITNFVENGRSWSDVALIRSEEHTSELQSRFDLVCRLLLEK